MLTREQLRSGLRQRRQQCQPADCQRLSVQICEHIRRSKLFINRKRIALYYATGNEVSLEHLFQFGWSLNKRLFLPVLSQFPKGRLWWVEYDRHSSLYLNKYHIPEPMHALHMRKTQLLSLDVVFMPLVGFDQDGNRLGMGGGFYDRSLGKCLHSAKIWQRPVRVGVAYSWQQIDRIPSEKWDVPLDAVITEHGLHWFKKLIAKP